MLSKPRVNQTFYMYFTEQHTICDIHKLFTYVCTICGLNGCKISFDSELPVFLTADCSVYSSICQFKWNGGPSTTSFINHYSTRVEPVRLIFKHFPECSIEDTPEHSYILLTLCLCFHGGRLHYLPKKWVIYL